MKYFLESPGRLASFEVIVPAAQDRKAVMANAQGLAGRTMRSLEVVWAGGRDKLGMVGVAEREDVAGFQAALKICYPNCEFGEIRDAAAPAWFDIRGNYHVFDASTTHGHPFAVMEGTALPSLMSKVCTAVQQAENAWVQFVFQLHDFNVSLDRLSEKMQKFERYLAEPVVRTREVGGRKVRVERPREERNGDFYSNARGIRRHLAERMAARQAMLSVRGLAEGEVELDSALLAANAVPYETLTSSFDCLRKYSYEIASFYDGKKPSRTWVRIGGKKTQVSRLEAVFEGRLLPDPKKFMGEFCDRYCGRNWLGRYHDRKPLPFVITGNDIGALVHLPDPDAVPNLNGTRGRSLPRSYHEKTGFLIGRYV